MAEECQHDYVTVRMKLARGQTLTPAQWVKYNAEFEAEGLVWAEAEQAWVQPDKINSWPQ